MSFFLITGLPRSRTAWLANYFTFGCTECWHDELLNGPEQLIRKMCRFNTWLTKTPIMLGHSDPANLLYWQELEEALDHPKWVIVWRNPDEVLKSCRRFIPASAERKVLAMTSLISDLTESGATILNVDFDRLDARLPEIEQYLGLKNFCPESRREMLCRFNIQIEAQTLKHEVKQILKMKGIPWE